MSGKIMCIIKNTRSKEMKGFLYLWVFVPLYNILPAGMCMEYIHLQAARKLFIC